jgi:hypothetical protein
MSNAVLVNGANGMSDVEGKVARVAMSELGNERISTEPWERARYTVRSVRVTDKSRGSERINVGSD